MEAFTFWHDKGDGSPLTMSTAVCPQDGADVGALAGDAAEKTGSAVVSYRRLPMAFPGVPYDPREGIADVESRYRSCVHCHLQAHRNFICFQRGNPDALVAAVGEGPGRNEDNSGTPFVGRSGKLQDQLFKEAGIDAHGDIFWMNLVGCRPCNNRWADNRDPILVERLACSERTLGLLQAVRPRIVICLGRVPTSLFWDEPPPAWTWHTITHPDHPNDWIWAGHARHPSFLLQSLRVPAMYKELVSCRRFYGQLRQMMQGLSKLSLWPYIPRYVATLQAPEIAGPVVKGK